MVVPQNGGAFGETSLFESSITLWALHHHPQHAQICFFPNIATLLTLPAPLESHGSGEFLAMFVLGPS